MLPEGVPRLWCPLISHYEEDGAFDKARTRAHLRRLTPWVKGFLLPGSTGDGWEMDDREIRGLLEIGLDTASELGLRVLVGVLKTDVGQVRATLAETMTWLRERSGCEDGVEAMVRSRVCGFTVCPSKGGNLSQEEIRSGLETVLGDGLPLSLYQLPQVTGNEMSGETVALLASLWDNLILFKDTSGADAVVKSGLDLDGVFTVRGAEGGYAAWTHGNGGRYDGLLLSTANTFPRELSTVLERLDSGDIDGAERLSRRMEEVVSKVFEVVGSLGFGNAFANANKAMDHVMAWGSEAGAGPGPMTHSGNRIPRDVITKVEAVLSDGGFAPARGYLQVA
jgi:4-hydroxy-tetrahydrodipicolinate synthase